MQLYRRRHKQDISTIPVEFHQLDTVCGCCRFTPCFEGAIVEINALHRSPKPADRPMTGRRFGRPTMVTWHAGLTTDQSTTGDQAIKPRDSRYKTAASSIKFGESSRTLSTEPGSMLNNVNDSKQRSSPTEPTRRPASEVGRGDSPNTAASRGCEQPPSQDTEAISSDTTSNSNNKTYTDAHSNTFSMTNDNKSSMTHNDTSGDTHSIAPGDDNQIHNNTYKNRGNDIHNDTCNETPSATHRSQRSGPTDITLQERSSSVT